MKIPIIDLMDYYYDDSVKLEMPETRGKLVSVSEPQAPQTVHHFKKPLLVAAALVLVLTGVFAFGLGFGRDAEAGQALQEELQPLETFSPPEALPSDQEEAASTQDAVSPHLIEGAYKVDDNIFCYGNLLYVDGSYYTMTENGPEPVEMQTLTTTVELYGTWDVDIDYAILDGELAFRSKTSTAPYTIVDGEKVTWMDYREKYKEDPTDLITPNVAVAEPVAGSSDTVMLEIYRQDKAEVDRCAYPFFYNIFTGEISDPLANVPELFDHGQMDYTQYNNARTRALVNVHRVAQTDDGDVYIEDTYNYVCDLNTGEMVLVWDLLEPYLPEVEVEGTKFDEFNGRWADDDTLLYWIQESIPNEEQISKSDFSDPWDRHTWLFSYNVATGTLNYKQRDVAISTTISNGNEPYVCDFVDEEGLPFQVVDSASGAAYTISGVTFQNITGDFWDSTTTRTVLRGDDGDLYLVDAPQLAWGNLSDAIDLPAEEIQSIRLVTDDWLCLETGTGVYCCRIPDDLAMMPLTVK